MTTREGEQVFLDGVVKPPRTLDYVWREDEPRRCLSRMHHTLWPALLVLFIWVCVGGQSCLIQSFRSVLEHGLLGLLGLRFWGREDGKWVQRAQQYYGRDCHSSILALGLCRGSIECSFIQRQPNLILFFLFKILIETFLHTYNMFWTSLLLLTLSPTIPAHHYFLSISCVLSFNF
jgi:hypothetical protein